MAHPSAVPVSQEVEAGAPPSAGYLLVPRQLRQDCRQVGINTLKLVLYIADATLGWEFSRWAALTYRVIVAEAGIPNDAGVRRATLEALASSLIEVQPTAAGTLYAIHRRYWLLARIQPKWHLYKRVPYDPQVDPLPLDECQPAITTIAQPLKTDAVICQGTSPLLRGYASVGQKCPGIEHILGYGNDSCKNGPFGVPTPRKLLPERGFIDNYPRKAA